MSRPTIAPGHLAAVLLLLAVAIAPAAADDDDCLTCHSGRALDDPRLDVDTSVLEASLHGEAGLSCTDCHAGLAETEDFPHGPAGEPACGDCHSDEAEAMTRAAHRPGNEHSPHCWSCHGGHDVVHPSDPVSRINPLRQPETCLSCHADPEMAARYGLPVREEATSFEQSVHYRALEAGEPAPSCTTCHGAHDNLAKSDPTSPISREHVAETCGTCHGDIEAKFRKSVHGSDLASGNPDVPTCTGCHTEHAIRGPQDPDSPVYATHIAATCAHCHEDETLAGRYDLAPARLETFLGSYHGAANRFGESRVANCASCHGAHDVLPSTDPESMTNPDNLVATCGTCHPNAGINFAKGKIHVRDDPDDNLWAWLVKRAYLTMIYGIMGIFGSFIVVDLWWRRRTRRAKGDPS